MLPRPEDLPPDFGLLPPDLSSGPSAMIEARDKRIAELETALRAIFLAADNSGNEQEWADMVSAAMTDERRALVAK